MEITLLPLLNLLQMMREYVTTRLKGIEKLMEIQMHGVQMQGVRMEIENPYPKYLSPRRIPSQQKP